MKLYDLNPDPEMSQIIGLLHATVTYNYQRLRRLVEGLTPEEIDYKGPQNELNSIAQLLRHLAVVDLHWVFRLQSKEILPDLKAYFGSMYDDNGMLPMVKGVHLETLLEEYEQIQVMFREVCLNMTDKDLLREVAFAKPPLVYIE